MRSDPDLEDFLHTRAPDLWRVALLLADDPGRARLTTEAVLVDTARDWRALSDEGRPSSRTWAGLLDRLLALPAATTAIAGDPLERAWRGLDRPTRLAWLIEHEDPPGLRDSIRFLGRMPSAPLPELLTTARARLREAIDDQRTADDQPPVSDWEADQVLRHLLDDLAAPAGQWGDPIDQVYVRLRTRRRRTAALLAGGMAVALAAGTGIALTSTRPAAPAPTPSARATFSLPANSQDRSAWAGWPARGNLARDSSVLNAVNRRYSGQQRILWAADVEGRRQVLLAPRSIASDDHPQLLILTGPAGTAVGDLEERQSWSFSGQPVIAAFDRSVPEQVRLIVLAPPDLPSAEVSRTVTVAADFTISRTWDRVPLDRGGAALALGPGRWATLLVRAGPTTTLAGMTDPEAWSTDRLTCQGCSWAEASQGVIATLRSEMAGDTGLAPDQISVRTLLDSSMPVADAPLWDSLAQEARALVLRWTLPSGATLQSVVFGGRTTNPDEVRWSTWLDATPVRAAEMDAPVTLHMGGGPDGQSRLIVLVPGGSAATHVTASTEGAVRDEATLTDGVAILKNTPDVGVTVTLHDKDGAALGARDINAASLWEGPWDIFKTVN